MKKGGLDTDSTSTFGKLTVSWPIIIILVTQFISSVSLEAPTQLDRFADWSALLVY